MNLRFPAVAAVAVPVVLALAIAVSATASGALDPAPVGYCLPAPTTSQTPTGTTTDQPDDPLLARLSAEQLGNAQTIYSVSVQLNLPIRAAVIAIATALQESNLVNVGNLGDNNDHDSLGLFQQRPSEGWGTPAQIMSPVYASQKFYAKLVTIPNWQTLPLTVAAQSVQISAYPNAYAKHEPLATAIVNQLTGGTLTCTPGEVSVSGWTRPVTGGAFTSGFRTQDRPTHDGVDIAIPKGTPIHAAASGIVTVATCNANIAGKPYSCDVDGGLNIGGCGWYVDLRHTDGTSTRYCHMLQRPFVQPGQAVAVGQIIGLSGTSGNSSGPHLHFETHTSSPANSSNATEPFTFMETRGVNLGSQAPAAA